MSDQPAAVLPGLEQPPARRAFYLNSEEARLILRFRGERRRNERRHAFRLDHVEANLYTNRPRSTSEVWRALNTKNRISAYSRTETIDKLEELAFLGRVRKTAKGNRTYWTRRRR